MICFLKCQVCSWEAKYKAEADPRHTGYLCPHCGKPPIVQKEVDADNRVLALPVEPLPLPDLERKLTPRQLARAGF